MLHACGRLVEARFSDSLAYGDVAGSEQWNYNSDFRTSFVALWALRRAGKENGKALHKMDEQIDELGDDSPPFICLCDVGSPKQEASQSVNVLKQFEIPSPELCGTMYLTIQTQTTNSSPNITFGDELQECCL